MRPSHDCSEHRTAHEKELNLKKHTGHEAKEGIVSKSQTDNYDIGTSLSLCMPFRGTLVWGRTESKHWLLSGIPLDVIYLCASYFLSVVTRHLTGSNWREKDLGSQFVGFSPLRHWQLYSGEAVSAAGSVRWAFQFLFERCFMEVLKWKYLSLRLLVLTALLSIEKKVNGLVTCWGLCPQVTRDRKQPQIPQEAPYLWTVTSCAMLVKALPWAELSLLQAIMMRKSLIQRNVQYTLKLNNRQPCSLRICDSPGPLLSVVQS